MYRLNTKRTEKKQVEENANVSFLDRQSGVHWSCYVLLFTDFVNFGQWRLSGLSLGAFINFTRIVRISRSSSWKLKPKPVW